MNIIPMESESGRWKALHGGILSAVYGAEREFQFGEHMLPVFVYGL